MTVNRISAWVAALLLGAAATAAAGAQEAPAPDHPTAQAEPGATPAGGGSATAPVMVVAGEPGTTPTQIEALRDGDNRLVTNGPVPDTPANRARYGKPLSHAGKKTPPSGN
jgi:hypothetical protein